MPQEERSLPQKNGPTVRSSINAYDERAASGTPPVVSRLS